jgi:hypothetical protein
MKDHSWRRVRKYYLRGVWLLVVVRVRHEMSWIVLDLVRRLKWSGRTLQLWEGIVVHKEVCSALRLRWVLVRKNVVGVRAAFVPVVAFCSGSILIEPYVEWALGSKGLTLCSVYDVACQQLLVIFWSCLRLHYIWSLRSNRNCISFLLGKGFRGSNEVLIPIHNFFLPLRHFRVLHCTLRLPYIILLQLK